MQSHTKELNYNSTINKKEKKFSNCDKIISADGLSAVIR